MLQLCSAGQCINTLALDCLLLKLLQSTVTVYSHGYWRLANLCFLSAVIKCTCVTVRVKLSGKMLLLSYCMKFFLSEPSTTEVCITNIIKPARTSAVTAANHISPTVSMVTVALDCYCSNSTTGNSLQPWSLGGKAHVWARVVQKELMRKTREGKWAEKCSNNCSSVV